MEDVIASKKTVMLIRLPVKLSAMKNLYALCEAMGLLNAFVSQKGEWLIVESE